MVHSQRRRFCRTTSAAASASTCGSSARARPTARGRSALPAVSPSSVSGVSHRRIVQRSHVMPGYRQRPTADTTPGHLAPAKKAQPRRQVIRDTTDRVPRRSATPRHASNPPGGKLTNVPNSVPVRDGDVPFKVEALQVGFYDHMRRRVGDVFTIVGKSAFSKKWMRRVDDDEPEHTTGAGEALKQRHIELKTGGPGVVRATGDEDVLE